MAPISIAVASDIFSRKQKFYSFHLRLIDLIYLHTRAPYEEICLERALLKKKYRFFACPTIWNRHRSIEYVSTNQKNERTKKNTYIIYNELWNGSFHRLMDSTSFFLLLFFQYIKRWCQNHQQLTIKNEMLWNGTTRKLTVAQYIHFYGTYQNLENRTEKKKLKHKWIRRTLFNFNALLIHTVL